MLSIHVDVSMKSIPIAHNSFHHGHHAHDARGVWQCQDNAKTATAVILN